MAYLDGSTFVWALAIVQIVGLVSAPLARLSEGSRGQVPCHWLFLGCLAAIGLATMLAVHLGPRSLLFCCLTMSIMVLVAVWDFRAHPRASRV
jgi:hypothetical protein